MTVQLSPARLDLYADCARCFWLHVNEGVERPSGPFPSLPSGMDGAIKDHFDLHRRRGTVPPSVAAADESLRLYPDQQDLDRCRRWQGPPEYAVPDSDVVLRGGVDDLLVTADETIAVLDYKTRGYPPDGGVPGYYRRQLALYTLILRESGYDVAESGYLLYYHPSSVDDGGTASFETTLHRVPVDTEEVEETLVAAVDRLNGPLPPPGDSCAYCGYAGARRER